MRREVKAVFAWWRVPDDGAAWEEINRAWLALDAMLEVALRRQEGRWN